MSSFTPPIVGEGAAERALAVQRMKNAQAVLYVTAHPDDEDAHTLTTLARAEGYRVGIYCLTRGESGENALDHRAYESLGALRTEELLRAAKWYGAEDVFFGPFFDYGYSKRTEEAFAKWNRALIVAELVRAIRAFRPDVVLSRFRGERSDGHAHHQVAGLAIREAFRVAPFADTYSDLNLEPFKPAALYVLDQPDQERRNSSLWEPIDSRAVLSPLGITCARIAELGYAEHRSQTAGKKVLAHARRQLYRCVARHLPHLGEARFGFRESSLLAFTQEKARNDYAHALKVLEHGLAEGSPSSELAPSMRMLQALAPSHVLKSRADDLWRLIVERPEYAQARSDDTEEPSVFFEPFPTLLPHVRELSLKLGDTNHCITLPQDPPARMTRRKGAAIYEIRANDPLLPHDMPSFVHVETHPQSNTFTMCAAVARQAHLPHDFALVRNRPTFEQGIDLRRAHTPPPDIRLAQHRVWYMPGRAECYGDALRKLGANVVETEVVPATAENDGSDTLLIGFRAYERFEALSNSASMLHTFAERGGHIVVMGQSAVFDPARDAVYTGTLPHNAPEACEEDQPVRLLKREHPLLSRPFKITPDAFEGWYEQFGSKFWIEWDPKYEPLIACADKDEPPQRGVLLSAVVGQGRYTYCALALHLQLARGHAGAYKIFVNLIEN